MLLSLIAFQWHRGSEGRERAVARLLSLPPPPQSQMSVLLSVLHLDLLCRVSPEDICTTTMVFTCGEATHVNGTKGQSHKVWLLVS